MALDTVGAAYHQNSIVHYRQRTFGLSGEIRVPRGVKESKYSVITVDNSLLGKYGYATAAFNGVGVKKSIAVIYSALLAYLARKV